jgi:hypothetical protein
MVRRQFDIRNSNWRTKPAWSMFIWNDFLGGWSEDWPRLSQYIRGQGANIKSANPDELRPVAWELG